METLRRKAKAWIYRFIFSCAAAYYLMRYSTIIQTYRNLKVALDLAGSLGVSWTLAPLALIFLYEQVFWKLFNPRYNFIGIWDFKENQHKADNTLDFSASGHMRIAQDTSAIAVVEGNTYRKIRNSATPAYVSNWHSSSCDLSNDGNTITASLVHDPSPDRPGGTILYGVEVFTVSHHEWGKPTEMNSIVYHCVGSGEPRLVYVKYSRRKTFSLIRFLWSKAQFRTSSHQAQPPDGEHGQQP